MVECRIGIAMTTLLTLTAMFASVRESSPIVSYVKAVDYWMIACIFFVFAVLFEFALLVWFGLTKEPEADEAHEETGDEGDFELREKLRNGGFDEPGVKIANGKRRGSKLEGAEMAKKIERMVVPVYLITFIIFNLIYWPWLLGSSGFFDWEVDPTYNAPYDED